MVKDIAMLVHHGRQEPLIDVPRREVGLAEIGMLICVVQFQLEGLGNLVV